MGDKIVVGPINRGLRNDVTPFNIDNDSFPVLTNAYQWRSRVKRKRGTSLLNRLTRFFDSTDASYGSTTTIILDGSGNGNILTGFSLQTNGNIVPGSVTITAPGPTLFTDTAMDGTLSPSGSINYGTGAITILAEAGQAVEVSFLYYPDLPVMGLRDFAISNEQFPGTLGFDTVYSYNISTAFPFNIYDVSFYKNPVTASYPGYTEKTSVTPTSWNGQDYQQFWTVNYQGAFWATNGVEQPFDPTNVGMQYNTITAIGAIIAGPPAFGTITTATNHGLSTGDFVFINEVAGVTGINFQTGYVTAVPAANQITVEFPDATLGGVYTSGGIVQYLTNRSDVTKDCLRWYDGDPTDGNATTPTLNGHLGWVNFAPPLSEFSFSIGEIPAAQYYLVGAKMIVPFRDRLLFFGPVVQTSSPNSQIYLQDTVVYSQNGTPFYTASYTNSPNSAADTPTSPTNVFTPILVPTNQTASPASYFGDQTGFGGFISAGIQQQIETVSINEDVLIVGFTRLNTRLVYSGNDVIPFNFFVINSEYGSGSTFSAVVLDKGVITKGSRGWILTSQVQSERVDLDIPDEVFEVRLSDNGSERVTAQRDFINEWIYFTYPVNRYNYRFPTQTLQFNYRDNSWGMFIECYTTYGVFRKQSGFIWSTLGAVYPTWASWTSSWDSGTSTLLQPKVIAGNQQGFVITRDDGLDEANSLYIRDITGSTVTSPDHCLNEGDYIVISGALGTVGAAVNGNIFSVSIPDPTTFVLNPPISAGLTYLGGGVIKRMCVPFIQSKQFPTAWGIARKSRLGVQQYLFTTTSNAQVQLLIYLSQDSDNPRNLEPIVPLPNSTNNSVIYSTVLYTCPESTNLGLTPANVNLSDALAQAQAQTWHRVNTSLIGDTVQVAISLSDAQMRDEEFVSQFSEIELHSMIFDVSPSSVLA